MTFRAPSLASSTVHRCSQAQIDHLKSIEGPSRIPSCDLPAGRFYLVHRFLSRQGLIGLLFLSFPCSSLPDEARYGRWQIFESSVLACRSRSQSRVCLGRCLSDSWNLGRSIYYSHHFAHSSRTFSPSAPFIFIPCARRFGGSLDNISSERCFLFASMALARRTPLDRLPRFTFFWIAVPVFSVPFTDQNNCFILPALPAVALRIGERITCFS